VKIVGYYETFLLNKLKNALEKEEMLFRKKYNNIYAYNDVFECIFFLDENKKVENLWINECEYAASENQTIQQMLNWILTKSKQRVKLLY